MYKFKEDKMNVPCYVWSEQGSIEQNAINQIKNASSLPFIFHHTALMSDAHQGYGVSIGSVIALKNVICPSMVGVDIGCGMNAVKTSIKDIQKEDLKQILGKIREAVPVGFSHHKIPQNKNYMPDMETVKITKKEYESALKQLGTLGGGNHFIEIQKGDDNRIWIMVHSGSRNLGYKVANHYNKLAKKMRNSQKHKIPTNWQLDYLPLESKEGKDYLKEMQYCQEFAKSNRTLMMEKTKKSFLEVFPETKFEEEINIHHNYASWEEHFGEKVMVHRKGATSALKGQLGIIPGSQGTQSYIVKGLGNPDSFKSCSHGAGRILSRKKAIDKLSLEEEKSKLEEKEILHSIRGQKDLDEAASAYKNIEEVIAQQKDLVEVITTLKPLAVIKG